MENKELASIIIDKVGGKANIKQVAHCMTRLRFALMDDTIPNMEDIKKIDGVIGCVNKGGQFQVIIGTTVASVYEEVCRQLDLNTIVETTPEKKARDYSPKGILNTVFEYLAGSLTPLIPIMIAASFFKTLAAVLGPDLMGVISADSNAFTLFTFVGDAGFYYLPIFAGYTAAKKFGCSPFIAMMLGAVLLHPTFMGMAGSVGFSVFGIPCSVQNYASSILPIILTVWMMSYVEKLLTKITPDVAKVFMIPFGTAIIMLPFALCILGPLGSYLGTYVCNAIIWFYNLAGPLGVALIGATFSLLVLSGMHIVLISSLFISFPALGYDAMLLPGILCASWTGLGIAVACIWKFKKPENKSLTLGYALTWFFGGVGEPMLYGLNIRYKTPLYASVISGFLCGLIAGFTNLTAYTLNTSNGVYGLSAFIGGPSSNYIALGITVVACIVIGFLVMMFMKVEE